MNINEILEDLYMLDPALRSEEAELKKILEKLISKRPEAEADEEFKARLKAELLSRMEQKRKPGFFIVHRTAITRAAAIAAALIIVLTFALRPGLLRGVMSPDRMLSSEQAFDEVADVPDKRPEPVHEGDHAVGGGQSVTGTIAEETTDVAKSMEQPDSVEPMEIVENEAQEPLSGPAAAPQPPAELSSAKRSMEKQLMSEMPMEYESFGVFSPEGDSFADGLAYDQEQLRVDDYAEQSSEEYNRIAENDFVKAADEPLSTFSIDVDTASYSNVRRFINSGRLPDPDAVRIEELINYFSYDYPQPENGRPFSITTELSECPWDPSHRLLLVGLQGYEVQKEQLPPANLVFLLDSSGSMQDENKLPLLKDSIALLIDTLRPEDKVSVVAYAGSAGLVLPPTAGNRKAKILGAIDRIEAGGSTAGGAGLDLAYKIAAENLFEDGNNRVILATDGDFNVGQSSEAELKAMIEARRDQGIFLTVLGLGMGNYKDARMEALADNGNGNYAYIDTLNEANKVLVTELSSTLLTIAKDVKIQIDFNPAVVDSYRLIGYENRIMAAEDFDNDKKDAGDIGAGHSVTALYEIKAVDQAPAGSDLAGIRFRYKNPDESQSQLITVRISDKSVPLAEASDNLLFASAVAEWGMILKKSKYAANSKIDSVLARAERSRGRDIFEYRAEFMDLVRKTAALMH